MSNKYLLLVCCGLVVCGGAVIGARKKRKAAEVKNELAQDEKSCINAQGACYCSKKCGPREPNDTDRQVWVENDPNGKRCYCKEWDRKNYDMRECAAKEARN